MKQLLSNLHGHFLLFKHSQEKEKASNVAARKMILQKIYEFHHGHSGAINIKAYVIA